MDWSKFKGKAKEGFVKVAVFAALPFYDAYEFYRVRRDFSRAQAALGLDGAYTKKAENDTDSSVQTALNEKTPNKSRNTEEKPGTSSHDL